MSEKKSEQVEQVEQNETEIELEVKPVKSLKTNLKGGMAEEAGIFDWARPTSGTRNCFSECELNSPVQGVLDHGALAGPPPASTGLTPLAVV